MAYQGYAQGLGRDVVTELGELSIGGFKPDLTIILDIPAGEGLARADRRHSTVDAAKIEDRYERMGDAFHKTLRNAFLDIAAREPERCAVVDAGGTPEEVSEAIWAQVCRRFAKELRVAA